MQSGGPRLDLSLAEQVRLILAQTIVVQLIRQFTVVGRELFDGLKGNTVQLF